MDSDENTVEESPEVHNSGSADEETSTEVAGSNAEAPVESAADENQVTATGGADEADGKTGEAETADLMPGEQLDSDNSDAAGIYEVNGSTSPNHSTAGNTGYQRLSYSSSSDELDSSGSSGAEGGRSMRHLGWDSSSSSTDSEPEAPDDSYLQKLNMDVSKVKVKQSLFSLTQSRAMGDFGYKRNYTCCTEKLAGNLNFIRRMRKVVVMEEHQGCVNALSFNQSGTLLASGSDDLKVILWDMQTHRPYIKFASGHEANVFNTKFMPYSNDSQVVTCSRDGQVRLAELSTTGTCRSTKKLAKHNNSAHKLAVETDAPHCLLSAGEDGQIFQIDLRVKKPTKLAMAYHDKRPLPLYSIDKHPNNPHEFVVGGRDQFIRIYDKRRIAEADFNTKGVLKRFYPHKFKDRLTDARQVTCAVYSYNGSEIVGTYNDDDIYLFNNEHSHMADSVRSYSGHRNSQTIKGVNFFGAYSEYIVSGSDCGTLFIWDKESAQAVQFQQGDEVGPLNVLEPHPSFPYLAVSGLSHSIKLFMPVGEELTDMSAHRMVFRHNVRRRLAPNALSSLMMDRQQLQIMFAIRRMEYRRRREARANAAGDGVGTSANMDTDEDSDEDESGRMDCLTS